MLLALRAIPAAIAGAPLLDVEERGSSVPDDDGVETGIAVSIGVADVDHFSTAELTPQEI